MYKFIFIAAVLLNTINMLDSTSGSTSYLAGNTNEFMDSTFLLKGQIKGQKNAVE